MNSKIFHIHLVSDSTGETVSSVARAVAAQFEGIDPKEHLWSLVRTKSQIERVISGVKENPGIVLHTIVDKNLRDQLTEFCVAIMVPCIPVLAPVLQEFATYLGQSTSASPGKQHIIDDEYFSRVSAINYSLAHDDGQLSWDIENADIILIGVSRSSKSPTSMYLAFRGYKVANIPYVHGCPLPDNIFSLKKPLIVGLTINAERLMEIRRNRLLSMNQDTETDYVDIEKIKAELIEVKRLFAKHGWPVIDVTRRSVEETAAEIGMLYNERPNE